jgi:hypothetical protein
MNVLGKTRRVRAEPDVSGEFSGLVNDRADKFMAFLSTNADNAFTRPWHRLERGLRVNRIRKFVADETERSHFTEVEQQRMFEALSKALDKKQLNSKSVVVYDTTEQKILEIKGFSFHRTADGTLQFTFSERKTGTLRRKPTELTQATSKIDGQPQP